MRRPKKDERLSDRHTGPAGGIPRGVEVGVWIENGQVCMSLGHGDGLVAVDLSPANARALGDLLFTSGCDAEAEAATQD